MIEPNSEGGELTEVEHAHFEHWEHEVHRSAFTKIADSLSYAAALISANIAMAGQELKDRILRAPGLRRGLGAVAIGLAQSAAVLDPGSYYSHQKPEQQTELEP